MAVVNVSDVELWWSHPNYTPSRKYAIRKDVAPSAGDRFRMDSSRPDIDEMTLSDGMTQVLSTKEYLGVGQSRKRRGYVNVADLNELSIQYIANLGTDDTPELFFKAVVDDPGPGNNGVKRPCRVAIVPNKDISYANSNESFSINGMRSAGGNQLQLDGAHANTQLTVGDWLRIAGDTTYYEVIGGGDENTYYDLDAFSPVLAAAANVGDVVTRQTISFADSSEEFAINNMAGYAAGVTTMNLDGKAINETLAVGDYFKITGYSTEFRVTAGGATGTGTAAFDVTFEPPLPGAVADNVTVVKQTVTYSDDDDCGVVRTAASSGDSSLELDAAYATSVLSVGDFFTVGSGTTVYQLSMGGSTARGFSVTVFPPLQSAAADNTVVTKQTPTFNIADANVSDYVGSGWGNQVEVDGQVMGSVTLQSRGTGFENARS